jgi:hypothetical protein
MNVDRHEKVLYNKVMTGPVLKTYHESRNIPQLREQVADQLELMAGEVRNGNMDLDALEHTLLDLSDISYGAFDRRFRNLWMWLRSLKAALRE